MFGYILINKPEIKVKDYDLYRSFYCGLCHELKRKFGILGQLTLSYDMTFVLILLNSLYEPKTKFDTTRCILHPIKKQPMRSSIITEYIADMNVLLSYYKCMDDWKDEKKYLKFWYGKLLEGKNKKTEALYRKKAEVIVKYLKELSNLETQKEQNIDKVAGCFGHIMEEILAYREDEWEASLRKIGFFLGKFIYILDAYDDIEKDVKNGCYNPFEEMYLMEAFETQVHQILVMMMAETCREFEKLPIIECADILRNILYSGVWSRFESTKKSVDGTS